ncbi:MAG: class I SAM-dependent methyltransferase [Anaerolineae bacterium]|nr:class I SAM-dependent methyltransferase [Anaerolineae bacterium]
MDEITRYNQERWNALVQANIEWSRPALDLTPEPARLAVDPFDIMGDVQGRTVLCLASGGGQQSVAFALLGAQVTVLDFSEHQLERDRQALEHYGLQARLVQGDMRDLSQFGRAAFDVIWHAYSINFVPDSRPVFDQVARVLRPGGLYRIEWHNPFSMDTYETHWTGEGYLLKHRYGDGEVIPEDPEWEIWEEGRLARKVAGPRIFSHSLSTVVNGLIGRGFILKGMWEERSRDPESAPGTWEHLKAFAPPWLTIWAQVQP